MGGPTIRRHESSGDIWTPNEFIEAVEANWGPLAVDLAAEKHSAKAPEYITPEVDSLVQDWTEILRGRRGWLNPPYSLITPWAMKCAKEYEKSEQNEIFLLVPGSEPTGSGIGSGPTQRSIASGAWSSTTASTSKVGW
jgi:phage N-6-adenine-methyltransferase